VAAAKEKCAIAVFEAVLPGFAMFPEFAHVGLQSKLSHSPYEGEYARIGRTSLFGTKVPFIVWSSRIRTGQFSLRSGQPAGGEHPQRRRARRFGDAGPRARSQACKIRPGFAASLGATSRQKLDRRQGEIRVDDWAGRSVYQTASGVVRHLCLESGAKAQGRVVRLAWRAQGAQTAQGRAVVLANKLARIV
jgi:hypothetical protein